MSFNLFAISNFTLAVTSSVLALFLLINCKTKLHKIWGIYNLSVAAWGIAGFFAGVASKPEDALFWWKISYVGVITIPIFLLHGICIFCGIRRNLILGFAYLQGLIFVLLIPTNFLFNGINFIFSQFYYPIRGNGFNIFFAIWMTIVIYSQYKLVKFYLKTDEKHKLQIRYLFTGLIIGFSGGLTNFFPAYFSNMYPFGNFGITLYSLIVVYSIFKHRLMDVSVVITKAGIFIAVYSIVLGIPFAVAFGWKDRLISMAGQNWWFIPLLMSTVLATIGPFIYLFIDAKAENRLLREQREYQNVLRGASIGMIRIKNLSKLLNIIVHVVTKTVKIAFSEIYLYDSESKNFRLQARRGRDELNTQNLTIDGNSPLVFYLEGKKESIVTEEMIMNLRDDPLNISLTKLVEQLASLKAALVIPSFVDNNLIGILLLGQKRSGKLYSADDLVVFSVLANQAALAIENAQFYEEIKRTHEQLFQAEKLATIGTMADGLSHQINNRFHALSLIAGDSLDVIKTYDASKCDEETKKILESLKEGLQRIESNVLQGGEVVKGLLKYSRPGEAGYESINFQDVLTGAIDMVKYKIKLGEIDLIQNIPQEAPKIHANLVQLQEVFFNLIDNAYDATKERQATLKEEAYRGRIEISARSNNGNLEIKVEDNGIGIKDLDKKKLFTPFFTTKATSRKGTGLGLYVIEKIVSAHHGTISIDSRYQSGTQFTIYLPVFSK